MRFRRARRRDHDHVGSRGGCEEIRRVDHLVDGLVTARVATDADHVGTEGAHAFRDRAADRPNADHEPRCVPHFAELVVLPRRSGLGVVPVTPALEVLEHAADDVLRDRNRVHVRARQANASPVDAAIDGKVGPRRGRVDPANCRAGTHHVEEARGHAVVQRFGGEPRDFRRGLVELEFGIVDNERAVAADAHETKFGVDLGEPMPVALVCPLTEQHLDHAARDPKSSSE